MMHKTFENFDNPNAPWNSNSKTFRNYNLPYPVVKYHTIPCDYISIQFKYCTVSDFTDCHVRDGLEGLEILTNNNKIVYYYHSDLRGYTYKIKNYEPHTDC